MTDHPVILVRKILPVKGGAQAQPGRHHDGVLQDLEDPYGAQLGRRGRRHLAQLGWTIGAINPASALLQAYHVDPARLRTELDRRSS